MAGARLLRIHNLPARLRGGDQGRSAGHCPIILKPPCNIHIRRLERSGLPPISFTRYGRSTTVSHGGANCQNKDLVWVLNLGYLEKSPVCDVAGWGE